MQAATQLSLDEKPYWLELPEEKPQLYWTCRGTNTINWWSTVKTHLPKFLKPNRKNNALIFLSKEEAEAYSSQIKSWKWDGSPATSVTLNHILHAARMAGYPTIVCKKWNNGAWEIANIWKVSEPHYND